MPKEEFLQSVGMQWEKDDVIAGIAVRLSPVKDVPTLLRAMKIASEKDPHLKLLIGGDGEDRQKLETWPRTWALPGKVCFAGWLDDVNSFYNAIDINLLTSISETFPYSLTEGTRMHKATIASKVGGVPVLIDDGVNGLIFEPGDEKQLAQHLLTLSQNRELRETFGERIYEKASREFSIDRMVEHQLEIYESILKRDARQKSRKRDGAVICGAYGYGNAGDDAILKSIIRSVQELDDAMPITVLAKNTQSIKKRYRWAPSTPSTCPRWWPPWASLCCISRRRHPDPKRHQLAQPVVLPVHLGPCQTAGKQGGHVRLRHRPGHREKEHLAGQACAGALGGYHHPAGEGLHGGAEGLWRGAAGNSPQLRPGSGPKARPRP